MRICCSNQHGSLFLLAFKNIEMFPTRTRFYIQLGGLKCELECAAKKG